MVIVMCRIIAKSTLITVLMNFIMVTNFYGQSVRTEQHIRLENPADKSKYILLAAPDNLNTICTFQFPISTGTNGQVLTSTFDGGMEWKTPASLPSLTQGSMLFSSGGTNILEDNSNLFWDDSNNRLGIGTNEPEASVHIVGDLIIGEGGTAINKVIRASATINSGSVGLQTYSTVKVTVIGARPNGHVIVNPRSLIHNSNQNQFFFIAYSFVSDDDEVSIVFGGTYSSSKNFTNKVFDILVIQ